MRQRSRTASSIVAALATMVILGLTSPARANFEIQLSATGAVYTTVASVASPGPAFYSGTFNGITISLLNGQSNVPGTPQLGQLLGSTLNLLNKSGSAKTIYIKVGDTGFTSPTAPPGINVTSHIGGSYTGTVSLLQYQSWIDPANGQNSLAGNTPGLQTPVLAGGSFQDDKSSTILSLSPSYSVTEYLKVTLANNASLNFGGRTDLASAPEPSSMAIAGLSALGMIGYGLRRRKAKAV